MPEIHLQAAAQGKAGHLYTDERTGSWESYSGNRQQMCSNCQATNTTLGSLLKLSVSVYPKHRTRLTGVPALPAYLRGEGGRPSFRTMSHLGKGRAGSQRQSKQPQGRAAS